MPAKDNKCCVEGCERLVGSHGAKGMCPLHYSKYRLTRSKGRCSVKGCQKQVTTSKLCSAHYHRLQRYGHPLRRPKKRKGKWDEKICSISGCTRLVFSDGLCVRHYERKRRGTLDSPQRYVLGLTRKYPEEYSVYKGIKRRCFNNHDEAYKNYGARGIKMCDRWLGVFGFKHFIEDMGPRPKDRLPTGRIAYSIDRIDVNGDYCPENCRWADWKTQANNRRPRTTKRHKSII